MELLKKVAGPRLKGITFAHLSRQNNNADLVRLMAGEAMKNMNGAHMDIARQDMPCEVIRLD